MFPNLSAAGATGEAGVLLELPGPLKLRRRFGWRIGARDVGQEGLVPRVRVILEL